MSDEYDEQTERMLPCTCNNRDGREGHFSSCAGYWREEVAAALREAGGIRDLLIRSLIKATGASKEAVIDAPLTTAIKHDKEIANLRAENEKFEHDAVYHRVKVEEQKEEIDALKAQLERLKESTSVVLISRLRNQYDEQVKCNDALRAEIAALKAEVERLRNDLSDALDVRAGHGPTVLTDLSNEIAALKAKLAEAEKRGMDLVSHLEDQKLWSEQTFGPGKRTKAVLDHIRKELVEIEQSPDDLMEWVDLILLACDGAWRAGNSPETIAIGIQEKLAINKKRKWPDWRTVDPEKAIEHDRAEMGEKP